MSMENSLESQIANLSFLEEMYQRYQSEPHTIDSSWKPFFQKFEIEKGSTPLLHPELTAQVERIIPLIEAYRRYGHLLAHVNPIALDTPKIPNELKPENLGFHSRDEKTNFLTFNLLPQPE